MRNFKKFKLILPIFFGFIISIVGVSKSDQANNIPLFDGNKISSMEESSAEMCRAEETVKSISLFAGCAGFLE